MTRALALLLGLLLAPAGAWAQCAGGHLSNCPSAVSPQSTDLVYGYQFGQTPHDRAFTVLQLGVATSASVFASPPSLGNVAPNTVAATTLSSTGAVTLGGNTAITGTLGVTGNTTLTGTLGVTGTATIGGNTAITGTLGATGTASFGTGQAAYITATGGAQATLGTGGAGNLAMNLRSAGTGLVQIGGAANSAIQITPNASQGGALTISQPATSVAPSTSLITIATSNLTTGGINFTSPMRFSRTWAYSGTITGSILNRPFQVNSIISGISNDLAGYGINQINVTYNGFSSFFGPRAFEINTQVGAGSMVETAIGSSVLQSQSGQPLTSANVAWLPNHAYALGEIVVNSKHVYHAKVAGTSAGAGGPTGTGSAIVDGTVTWDWDRNPGNLHEMIGLNVLNSAAYNLGGTATGAVGSIWGTIIGSHLNTGATFYANSAVVELDDQMDASVRNATTLLLAKFGRQGSNADLAIDIGGIPGGSPTNWRNPIIFRDAVDPNGVAITAWAPATGNLQTMAGFMDLQMVDATGSNTQAGPPVHGGGGYLIRGVNSQWRGNGDFQIGNAGFVISANSLTIDTTYQLLTAVGALAGGSAWTTGDQAADDFGNQGVVTAVAGVPTALNIVGARKTYVATASVPGGAVNWWPLHAGQVLDDTGGRVPIVKFTTATETYSAGTTLSFGTGAATTINIGRAASNTTIAGTISLTGLPTTCAAKPTNSVAAIAGVLTLCP